jgi:hypothetical protein
MFEQFHDGFYSIGSTRNSLLLHINNNFAFASTHLAALFLQKIFSSPQQTPLLLA